MISLQDSGESGDKVQNDVTTTKHIVTYTILYNITIKKNTILVIECYTRKQEKWYYDTWINVS